MCKVKSYIEIYSAIICCLLLTLGMASGCIHFDNVDITSKYVDTDLKEYNCNYSAAPQAPAPQSWGTPGA